MVLYAEVIINSEAVEIDKPFTYKVSPEDIDTIEIGHRVSVPFGNRSQAMVGYVVGLKSTIEETFRIKKIKKILDKEPILRREDLLLIEFLRKSTLCKWIDAIRLLIPVGVNRGIKNKTKKNVVKVKNLEGPFKCKENYIKIMEFIEVHNGEFNKAELKENGFSIYSINKLIENGFLDISDHIVYRYNERVYEGYGKKTLTDEQKNAIECILKTEKRGILLNGVTGSGKTEIYMEIVEKNLKEGKGAIILVPEISLTPQMIERFKGRFGKNVSLYHSKLSEGERYDEWHRIKSGECKLVIGARSALFLPVNDLGIIVVDEEHERSYKSEHNPKYSTKEVCEFLSEIYDAKYILGSATPSVESFAEGLVGKIELINLEKRIDNRPLPKMEIVDMRIELKDKNLSMISRRLYSEMKSKLEKKEQIILFLNRRGFSTFVSCRSCGYVFKCEKCDIAMTYHKEGYLECHYCGMKKKEVKTCPKCESKYVKFFGSGTEKLENEVKRIFKDANVLRMDADTTKNKDSYEKIYNQFKNREADILIGTQMITKGYDFENVTLVGVMAADMAINMPDYRASERAFQLINQVGGRAGRGDKEGLVIVQSYDVENKGLQYAVKNDYKSMFREEFKIRKLMNYPPFGKIIYIKGLCTNEARLINFMKSIKIEIEKISDSNIIILGPTKCIIKKYREFFRYQIIVKGKIDFDKGFEIKELLYKLNKNVYNDIRISVDINPNNLL